MNKAEEIFDIYDERMNWMGTAPRSEVHAKGLWHRTFQCWVVSLEGQEPKILLQLRHPEKDLFPNLLDISSAGHLAAGETTEDGVRELEEELGLTVDFNDLIPCGTYAEEDLISDQLMDREFCHVFIHRCDQPLKHYTLQTDEVSGLFAVRISDLERLVHRAADQITAIGFKIGVQGEMDESTMFLTLNDLVPHPVAYFDLIFRTLRENDWLK